MHLTDQQWSLVQPLLPAPPPPGIRGRPNVHQRIILDAVLWRLSTGLPWYRLPADYGSWHAPSKHCRKWSRSGLLRRVIDLLLHDLRTRGLFDCTDRFRQGAVQLIFQEDHYEIYFQASLIDTWQASTSLLFYRRLLLRAEEKLGFPPHPDLLTALFPPSPLPTPLSTPRTPQTP